MKIVPTNCKNCGSIVHGNFCGNCGQRVIYFNFKYLVENLTDSLELKKGILYNVKALTFAPGKAITDYMSGRTKPFLNPIAYSLAVLTLLFLTGNRFEQSFNIGPINGEIPYFIHIFLFSFPIMFGLGSYLAYNKHGFNYIQHFILSLFLVSHFILVFVIPYVFIQFNVGLLILVFFIYSVWVYQIIFREHVAATIVNQFTILLQASFFELIFMGITYGIIYLIKELITLTVNIAHGLT